MIPKFKKPELEQDFTAENIKNFLKWMKLFTKEDVQDMSEFVSHACLVSRIPKYYPIRKIVTCYEDNFGYGYIFETTILMGNGDVWTDIQFCNNEVKIIEGGISYDPQIAESILKECKIQFSKDDQAFVLSSWGDAFVFLRALRNNLYKGVPPCE